LWVIEKITGHLTFVRLKQASLAHQDLAKRLDELEAKTEHLGLKQDALANLTRKQLTQVFDAPRQLMQPTEPPPQTKRAIGFVQPDEETNKPKPKDKLSNK
jgi:hypothetical protein